MMFVSPFSSRAGLNIGTFFKLIKIFSLDGTYSVWARGRVHEIMGEREVGIKERAI